MADGYYPYWRYQPNLQSLGHTITGIVYQEHLDPITGELTAESYVKCSCGQRGGWMHTAEILGLT